MALYMHDCILNDIASLADEGLEGRMRAFLIRTVVERGNHGPNVAYGARIANLLARTDHVLRGKVPDYISAMKAIYPTAL